MNARDFCYWLQGYIELTDGEWPTDNRWLSILEHLALAKGNEDHSREEFVGVVSLLSGFTAVAGNELPTEEQWFRIVDIVSGVFDKVTSTLDKLEENTLDKILEEIHKGPSPYQPLPPFMPPTPWEICDSLDTKAFCANVSDVACCGVLDSAYDSQIIGRGQSDMYDLGINIADSNLGDR